MQLVPDDNRTEDISETEPILSRPSRVESSEESSSSIEITVCGDCSVSSDDLPSPDIHQNYSLVQTDQPQCRICLDSEGVFSSFTFSLLELKSCEKMFI